VFLGACAEEKPDAPRRLNPLDPATELAETNPFGATAEIEGQSVRIRWQPPGMTEIAGWVVLRSNLVSFLIPDTLATLDRSTTSLLDADPSPGKTYYYKILATDRLGRVSAGAHLAAVQVRIPTAEDYVVTQTWGAQGSGPGEMEVVRDVAVDGECRVWVSDVNNGRVQILSCSWDYVGEIVEADGLPLSSPYGLAIDGEGSLYVVDTNNHRVVKYNASGVFLWSVGARGTGPSQFQFPRDVCVDGDGFLYVLDTGNDRIQKFTAEGAFQREWGGRGPDEGWFDTPCGLAEARGSIFVADSYNMRIQVFTTQGEFQSSWNGFDDHSLPRAVEADTTGNVFVLDSAAGAVHKFAPDGALVAYFGTGDLGNPEGLWVNPDGDSIWVADTYDHRVLVFERQ